MNILDEIFNDVEAGVEEDREPNVEKARDPLYSYISGLSFTAPLSTMAIECLNARAAKQGVGIIPATAYAELATSGWYIVCWQDETTMWEYDPQTGETRHCGIGPDFVWTDWE